MTGLPKSIIKKYGVTKKAWQVFRGNKTVTKPTRMKTMARRGFKKHRSSSRGSSGISVMNVLLAGAVYGAVRPTIANMLPTFFKFGPVDSDNVILGGAGYLASRQSNKFIKTLGLVAMGTEAGIITSQLMTPATTPQQASAISTTEW